MRGLPGPFIIAFTPATNHAVFYVVRTSLTDAFLLVSLVLVPASAAAQSGTDSSAVDVIERACEVAKQTVNGSALCEQEAQAIADSRLNEVYAQTVDKIQQPQDGPHRAEVVQRLIEAERAWFVFRDAEAISAPLEGYEYQVCRYEQTKFRVKALVGPGMPQNAMIRMPPCQRCHR